MKTTSTRKCSPPAVDGPPNRLRTQPLVEAAVLSAVRELYAAIERFDAHAASTLGVDRTAVRAIDALERGALTAGQLAERLGLTSGATTSLVKRLEAAGFVASTADLLDRRIRHISLTSGGYRRASAVFRRIGSSIGFNVRDLSGPELEQMAAQILRLTRGFDEAAIEQASVIPTGGRSASGKTTASRSADKEE